MENTPNEAPAAAPAAESVASPINSNPNPAAPAMPDMHGFTSDQLADMKKFFDNNGGFDKIKARISNPEPIHKIDQTPTQAVDQTLTQAVQPQVRPEQEQYQVPAGAITQKEWMAREYAKSLGRDPKYAALDESGYITNGAFLKDLGKFNIQLMDRYGNFNEEQVLEFLNLKAQTIPAKQTSTTPEASSAPTVEYAPYDENNLTMQQAAAILQQDTALKSRGLGGHPNAQQAEEFMKKLLNKKK